MKRLILILFVLALSVPCEARMSLMQVAGSGGSTALACSGATIQQQEIASYGTYNIGDLSTKTMVANQFAYSGSNGTLCRIDFQIKCATSDCTQVLTGTVYDDSGSDTVGTNLLGTCSVTYSSADLDTSYAWVSVSGCSVSLSSGTKYWMIFNSDSYNAANYLTFRTDDACTGAQKKAYGNGGAWTYSTTSCVDFKLYILE